MAFIRKIKKKSGIYLAEVESYRENGKVKQRYIRYIGKEIAGPDTKMGNVNDIEIEQVREYLDYKVLHEIAVKLKIPELLGEELRTILLLVYTQMITRKSINALPAYVEQTALKELLGIEKLVNEDLYNALDKLDALNFALVEREVLSALQEGMEEEDALILDVTDTYFKGKRADWKSRKGKDGKVGKLIQVALAVTKTRGFPILHKTYEGNINNIKIFEDLLASVRLQDYSLIVLDRGLNSTSILNDLTKLKQPVITGLKQTSTLQRNFLSGIDREALYQPKNRITLTKVTLFYKSFDYRNGKLIVLYDPLKEASQRTKAMENEEKYNKEKAKYMGYSLLYHTTELEAPAVVKMYFEKDIVEKAYRNIKSVINLNPVRKHRINRMRAHVKICYIAYAILSYINNKVKPLGLSATAALEQLQGVYKVDLHLKEEDIRWSKIVTLKKVQNQILGALECSV